MKPSWSWRDGLVHLNYELPHRVHTTKIYPIRAPNGSSVILYGHEHGLTVMWRGGRPFKNKHIAQAPAKDATRKVGRAVDTSVMIIDSDEDELAYSKTKGDAKSAEDEFETDEEEYDPAEPYDQILEVLDVPGLQTPVLHLGVPSISLEARKNATGPLPPIFHNSIVVAAACADSSIRILTIPLLPRQNQRRAAKGPHIQQHIIYESSPASTHLCRGVSLTWTGRESAASPGHEEIVEWSLLIASHTAQAGGVLSIFQQQLNYEGSKLSKELASLIRAEHIHNPATAVAFSPSQYPARRHTQLLLVDTKGAVRIYDPFPRGRSQSIRSNEVRQQTSAQRGVWLASIYAPFESSKQTLGRSVAQPGRSRILDAQWAFDGNCIIALLADGQWGVWDIEGIGPTATKSGQYNAVDKVGHGLSAGSITRFALGGFVGDGATTVSSKIAWDGDASSTRPGKENMRLAPMTPNTRKVKQQKLFNGPTPSPTSISTFVRGGISLAATPNASAGSVPDESLVIWYGGALFAVPSLMAYWQRVAGSGNKAPDSGYGTLFGPNVAHLSALSAQGELVTSVSQTPCQPEHYKGPSRTKLQHDILMAAEHRFVILCREKSRDQSLTKVGDGEENSVSVGEEDIMRLDEEMLSKSQLDLGGLDRMLDGMASGNLLGADGGVSALGRDAVLERAAGRKVGFAAGF